MSNLIVIVDPHYGARLETVGESAPLWVVDTPINMESIKRLWKARPHADHRGKSAITSYKTQNPEDRLSSLLSIMPELETHHGKVEGNELPFPKGFVLGVVGLQMGTEVTSALQNLGFKTFIESPDGFEARK